MYRQTRVYNRVAGGAEGVHPGAARQLDPAAEAVLEMLLAEGDPQAHGYAATGWAVPLLRTEWPSMGGQPPSAACALSL